MANKISYRTLSLQMRVPEYLLFKHHYNRIAKSIGVPKLIDGEAIMMNNKLFAKLKNDIFDLPIVRPVGIVTAYNVKAKTYEVFNWHSTIPHIYKRESQEYIIFKLLVPIETKTMVLRMIGTQSKITVPVEGPLPRLEITNSIQRLTFATVVSDCVMWTNQHNRHPSITNILRLSHNALETFKYSNK